MKTIKKIAVWMDSQLGQHSDWWQQQMIRETVDDMVEASGRKTSPCYSEFFEFAHEVKVHSHKAA